MEQIRRKSIEQCSLHYFHYHQFISQEGDVYGQAHAGREFEESKSSKAFARRSASTLTVWSTIWLDPARALNLCAWILIRTAYVLPTRLQNVSNSSILTVASNWKCAASIPANTSNYAEKNMKLSGLLRGRIKHSTANKALAQGTCLV